MSRASKIYVFVHVNWATKGRARMIQSNCQQPLYDHLRQRAAMLKCSLLEVGGMEDHVHVLVDLHSGVPISLLVKEMKAASSHWMNHGGKSVFPFAWQEGYFASSVDPKNLDPIAQYISTQQERHNERRLIPSWEPR